MHSLGHCHQIVTKAVEFFDRYSLAVEICVGVVHRNADVMKSAARKLISNFVDEHGQELPNVYAVERQFELHLPNAIVNGRADVIIRKDNGGAAKYEIDDCKVSEGDDLKPYDRQLRTYTRAGRREGLQIVEANVFDLKRSAQKRTVDISPSKIADTETEMAGLVERLKARDFVPSPGSLCQGCDVRQLCKYRE